MAWSSVRWQLSLLFVFVRLPTGVCVKDAGFDCEWTDVEDASLLRGVYKYGAGNWDAVRMDSELKLSEVRYYDIQL